MPAFCKANQEYILTVHVDEAFLRDENTAYPIRIDPTIEINYDSNGSGAIEDVTINSLQGSDGSSGSLFVGKRDTYGISRTLMKFPGLDLSVIGNASHITNATVEIRDLQGQSEAIDVYCYTFTGNTWSESTASWSNVNPNSYGTLLNSKTISYAEGQKQTTVHRYPFNITEAVKGWKAGNFDRNKGILFKANSTIENGSSAKYKTFASYNRSQYQPSLTVTYSPTGSSLLADDTYYINNANTGKYLKYASSAVSGASGTISSLGNSIRWQVRHVDGGWVIRSASDTTKYLSVPTTSSNSSVEIVTISNGTIPNRCKWTVTVASGGGLLIKNVFNARYLYSNGTSISTLSSASLNSAYKACTWRCISISSYGTSSSYSSRELTSSYSVNSMTVTYGSKATPVINKSPSNALWANPKDFTYTSNNVSYATVDNTNALISGQKVGSATINVTHKVTGLTTKFTVTVEQYVLEIGLSTENYDGGCPYGARGSFLYGENFFNTLKLNTLNMRKEYIWNWNKDEIFFHASKNDFQNGSSNSGVIANNVDFMVYIGHGIAANRDEGSRDTYIGDRNKGNFLHYNYSPTGGSHKSGSCHFLTCHCTCYNDEYNLYTSEAKFGSSTSRLRWVWLYTCNFLNVNDYVTEDDLKSMMNGAHIVLGYGSTAYLSREVAVEFAEQLNKGAKIIDAFFSLADIEAGSVDGEYIQRAIYCSAAENETINSVPVKYAYTAKDVKIVVNSRSRSSWS